MIDRLIMARDTINSIITQITERDICLRVFVRGRELLEVSPETTSILSVITGIKNLKLSQIELIKLINEIRKN